MVKNITAKEAQKLLDNGEAILVDVREADEFKSEHIACAISVPLGRVNSDLPKLAKGRKVIFQCMKGGRGSQACEIATEKLSENEIYNLEGGILAWKEAGLPVIASAGCSAGISIFRQVQIIAGSLIMLFILLDLPIISAIIGGALALAGITGWCGLAMLLGKMPWNKPKTSGSSCKIA